MRFDHENLDCYRLALGVARWVATLRLPAGRNHLRDQLQRSAESVVLNIAEGRARGADAGRNHFRIAMGSAAEACAALDLIALPEVPARQAELRRVAAMLRRMAD